MGRELKLFGGMCALSLIFSYVICMWVLVQYVVTFLFASCLLLLVIF
jgi:hypothetical protein